MNLWSLVSLASLATATATDKLQIGILKRADPCTQKAQPGDKVAVHYSGKLLDGTEFDSSYNRKRPIEFVLGAKQVISGWEQGIQGMCVGEKRKLTIPPHLAYGKSGAGQVIGPDATLVFVTELVSIEGKDEL